MVEHRLSNVEENNVRVGGGMTVVIWSLYRRQAVTGSHLLALPCQIGRNFEIVVFTDLCKGLYGLHTTINLCGKILCRQRGKGHSIQICDLILTGSHPMALLDTIKYNKNKEVFIVSNNAIFSSINSSQ